MVDGPGHYVPWCQFAALVETIHEAGAVRQLQKSPFAPYRFGNQERLGVRMVQTGRVELVELHVANTTACTPGHGNAITGCAVRIGGVTVGLGCATGSDDGEARPEKFYMVIFKVQYVGANAAVAWQCQFAIGNQVYRNTT